MHLLKLAYASCRLQTKLLPMVRCSVSNGPNHSITKKRHYYSTSTENSPEFLKKFDLKLQNYLEQMEKRKKEKLIDQKLKSDVGEINRMLGDLKSAKPYSNKLYLEKAITVCARDSQKQRLLEVLPEWFRQARPIFDQLQFFRADELLDSLAGMHNYETDYKVTSLLGWASIEYFMQRMVDFGFDKFDDENIIKTILAVRKLQQNYSKSAASASDEKGVVKSYFLNALSRYFNDEAKRSKKGDLSYADAIGILTALADIRTEQAVPIDLLRTLCVVCKNYFVKVARNKTEETTFYLARQVQYYSSVWLKLSIDPDTIVADSWEAWYDFSARFMNLAPCCSELWDPQQCFHSTKNFAADPVNVAAKFNEGEKFWNCFPIWSNYAIVECEEMHILRHHPYADKEKLRLNFESMFWNLATLTKSDFFLNDHKDMLKQLLPALEIALTKVYFLFRFDQKSATKVLSAFIILGQKAGGYEFSEKFTKRFGRLCGVKYETDEYGQRCLFKDSDRGKWHKESTALFMLIEELAKTDIGLVSEKLLSFLRSIKTANPSSQLFTLLTVFGDVCSSFNLASLKKHGETSNIILWKEYFSIIGDELKNEWVVNFFSDIDAATFLRSILNVVETYELIDEFQSIKSDFSCRLEDTVYDELLHHDCYVMLDDLLRLHSIFGNRLLDHDEEYINRLRSQVLLEKRMIY